MGVNESRYEESWCTEASEDGKGKGKGGPNMRMVRAWSHRSTDINWKNYWGWTLAHWAAYHDQDKILEFLHSKGAQMNIYSTRDLFLPLTLKERNEPLPVDASPEGVLFLEGSSPELVAKRSGSGKALKFLQEKCPLQRDMREESKKRLFGEVDIHKLKPVMWPRDDRDRLIKPIAFKEVELRDVPPHIKLVLFDMDLTILKRHIRGELASDDINVLVKDVTPVFVAAVKKILESVKNGRDDLYMGVVTFSDERMKGDSGDTLVRYLIGATFANAFRAECEGKPDMRGEVEARVKEIQKRFFVASGLPKFDQSDDDTKSHPIPGFKRYHIAKARALYEMRTGTTLEPREIVVFDDDPLNIEHARDSLKVRAILVPKKDGAGEGMTVQNWNDAME